MSQYVLLTMWAFTAQTSRLFHPLSCCMPSPNLVFQLFASLNYPFHAAEGIILMTFQFLGSFLEVDWMANVKTKGLI